MRPDLFEQFQDKRIFLTGHTGFKGSWLALWLQRLGAEVVGFALEPPTDPSHFEVANVEGSIARHIVDDIRDAKAVARAIHDFQPHLVMHLAAQSVVRRGYDDPLETFSTNVMGTANVLEAVRQAKRECKVFVVTSDKCYENVEQTWGYRECDPMGDHDPYGGSKGAAEIVVRTYRHSYFNLRNLDQHGVWLASARAGNVIGGGDWTTNALIVDVFKALSRQGTIEIRSPLAVRPWQHVLQCLSGYLTICAGLLKSEDPDVCSGWNIGPQPGGELTVAEVVETFLENWGGGHWSDVSDPEQLREAHILRLSIDKALTKLNWRPCWDVFTTLQKTASWYQQYLNNPGMMQEFSLSQIAEYQELMFQTGQEPENTQANAIIQ